MNIISNCKFCLRERHLNKLMRRNFSQSECCLSKNSSREAKFFGKLIGTGSPKKRRFYLESDIGSKPSLQTLSAIGSKNKTSKENSRRVQVLNKLFMRNITDLMVTGQHSADLIGHGLEISRVAVSSDFNKVNVYWLARDIEDNSALEKLLLDVSFSLRHELSQLRIMGIVPRIEFIKDKHYAQVVNVERLLNTLDTSEEVEVPTHPEIECVTSAATEKTEEQKECINVNENNQKLNKKEERTKELVINEKLKQEHTLLPQMEHTALNLDHTKIMNRIKNAVIKSKALHRKDPDIAPPSPPLSSLEVLSTSVNEEIEYKERREQIAKFLLQRKILREKAVKKEKKYGPDINLPAQNVENELPFEFFKYTESYDSEQDYDYVEEEDSDETSRK